MGVTGTLGFLGDFSMAREMLKLRKGDSAIMIKADGSIEMAGLQGKELISEKGHISPTILFAAAWARKDDKLLVHLVKNFQECVREGYFGADAQKDFKEMEIANAKNKIKKERGDPTTPVPVQMEPTETPEETAKREKEEANLQAIADKGQDPRVKKQQEALKKGATKTVKKEYDKHIQPDLPVEQTMKYLKATPDQQKEMLEKQKKIIGNATIEENKDNEN
jgi:hypothetical protein